MSDDIQPKEPAHPSSSNPQRGAFELRGVEIPPPERDTPHLPRWEPPAAHGNTLGALSRILLLLVVLGMLIMPFTPFASKLKQFITEMVENSRKGKTIDREVVVQKEVVKEVIREVPAPPPPLPSKFVPRKDVDVATLFNGITIESKLETNEGNFASLSVADPDAYKVEFKVKLNVPKPNQTVAELARLNSNLPKMLPDLEKLLSTGKVSGFYHKLYENKVTLVQRSLTHLNRLLDRHNFFDCETILELQHPESKRRALLFQSDMDVVADGSDGDRMTEMSADIYNSDFYQPFTSYEWPKVGAGVNPLLAKWQAKNEALKKEAAQKTVSAARKTEIKAQMQHLETEIKALKSRSSLIAEKDPFIVISLLFKDYPRIMSQAPAMGDYAAVIHEDKIYPAICGDYGPSMKMGEASLILAKKISDKVTPYIRGEDALKVTYLVFPGTADKPFGPPDYDKWHEKISSYLAELGGLGKDYTLFKWEMPKPPEPPAIVPDGQKTGAADVKPPVPPATGKPASAPGETAKTPVPPAPNVKKP
ncbi:MAG: glycoside hydrolase family 75 protein [Verrucomicrobiaceae bacterium]